MAGDAVAVIDLRVSPSKDPSPSTGSMFTTNATSSRPTQTARRGICTPTCDVQSPARHRSRPANLIAFEDEVAACETGEPARSPSRHLSFALPPPPPPDLLIRHHAGIGGRFSPLREHRQLLP